MGAWILIASFAWAAFGAISLFGPELFTWQTLWSKVATYGGAVGERRHRISSDSAPRLRRTPMAERLSRHRHRLSVDSRFSAQSQSCSFSRSLRSPRAGWCKRMTDQPPTRICGCANRRKQILGRVVRDHRGGRLLGGGMSIFIDPNKYSLHAMYRNRLIRAYLGASRKKGARHPNPFTGFDPNDNIAMAELWRRSGTPQTHAVYQYDAEHGRAGFNKLAWQERKAESFTVTPLHSGSFWVGYRQSDDYARRYSSSRGGERCRSRSARQLRFPAPRSVRIWATTHRQSCRCC